MSFVRVQMKLVPIPIGTDDSEANAGALTKPHARGHRMRVRCVPDIRWFDAAPEDPGASKQVGRYFGAPTRPAR